VWGVSGDEPQHGRFVSATSCLTPCGGIGATALAGFGRAHAFCSCRPRHYVIDGPGGRTCSETCSTAAHAEASPP